MPIFETIPIAKGMECSPSDGIGASHTAMPGRLGESAPLKKHIGAERGKRVVFTKEFVRYNYQRKR